MCEKPVYNEQKIPILAVVGPTASGKTSLAVELAKECSGEIISADSMQVYRDMKIGTAQPEESEKKGIRHHLIGFLPADEKFSVADFTEIAGKCAHQIFENGKLPILAGGTGLYVRSLLQGINFDEQPFNPILRQKLQMQAEKLTLQQLWEKLYEVDEVSAKKIHPNNKKRVLRALEVYYSTGIPISVQAEKAISNPSPYKSVVIGITFNDRQILYNRINKRVDSMMEKGLLQEAKDFFDGKLGQTAAQAIGYKELKPYLDNEISLEQAVDNLKKETRHYAKRQLTWFRREPGIMWVYGDDARASVLEQSRQILQQSSLKEYLARR